MDKKKLEIARNKIDRLDISIFNLIKKRTKIVKYMLSLKESKNQIVDKKRISIIFKKIRKKSIQHGVDPKMTFRIWKTMIWSYIRYQRKNFKKK
mgnify:CR=1 FL=1